MLRIFIYNPLNQLCIFLRLCVKSLTKIIFI